MSSTGDGVDTLCKEATKLKLEGNNLFKVKKYKAAATKYRQAIAKDPSCPVYYTNLCLCLDRLKQYEEMNTVASKCIAIDENSVKGHYLLVTSLKHLKKYKEALRQSEAALQKFPDNADMKLLHSELGMHVKHCEYVNCPNQKSDLNTKDLLKCSSCKISYYCSKSCQKKDWHSHKFACKMQKDGSVESYSTGAHTFDCASCKKRFPITHVTICRNCNVETYCSSICEENDKDRHELKCQIAQMNAIPKKLKYFINKWYDCSTSQPILELATHAMTKKQFLSENPGFYIQIELCFKGNYCSFVPTKPPQIIYLSDLMSLEVAAVKQMFAQYKDSVGPFQVAHIIYSKFRLNGKEITMRRHVLFDAESFRCISFEEAMGSSFNQVNNMFNPILPPSWKDIFHKRLLEQLKEWALHNQILTGFVLTSFRCYSMTSFRLPDQYVLVFTFEHGEKLGEVKRLVSYSMKKIADLKDPREREYLVQKIQKTRRNTLEGECTFFLMFKSKEARPFFKSTNEMDIPFTIPIFSIQMSPMKEEEIDKAIRKHWKALLKIPFPKCPPTPEYPKTFYVGS